MNGIVAKKLERIGLIISEFDCRPAFLQALMELAVVLFYHINVPFQYINISRINKKLVCHIGFQFF
jgi:hypothetical protein